MSKELFFTDEMGATYPSWKMKKLKDVLNLHSGKDQKGFEDPNGKYPILATGGEIGRTNTPLCTEESVLIGRKGTIDKPRYINTPFRTVDTLFYTTMKDSVCAKFVYSFAQTVKWASLSEASGVPSLNSSIILNIDCALPSLPEQKKIAGFFSALDERIALTAEKIKLLKEQKQGYLQRVFDREIAFVDENGESYPEWEQKKLGEVATNSSKKFDPAKSDQSKKCIELETLNGGGSGIINGWMDSTDQKSIKNTFAAGDVLLGKLRPYLRKWARPDFDGVCSTEIWVLTSKEEITNEFLYALVQSPSIQQTLIDITSGTKMPRADWKIVAGTQVCIPSIPEQEKIAKFFSALDEQIELTESKLSLLKEQKKGYLQGIFG